METEPNRGVVDRAQLLHQRWRRPFADDVRTLHQLALGLLVTEQRTSGATRLKISSML
jgi:hypothetical protein